MKDELAAFLEFELTSSEPTALWAGSRALDLRSHLGALGRRLRRWLRLLDLRWSLRCLVAHARPPGLSETLGRSPLTRGDSTVRVTTSLAGLTDNGQS